MGSHNPAWVKQRLENFTKASHENLRADISRGHGEYLVSLATLALAANHFLFHWVAFTGAMLHRWFFGV